VDWLQTTLTRPELDSALKALAQCPSLVSASRACVGFSAGGRAPEVHGWAGFGKVWIGSVVPWWLFPLRLIAAGDRTLAEITEGSALLAFAREADPCFTLQFHSFDRDLLEKVYEFLRMSRVSADPGEFLERDATALEVEVTCDGGQHDSWVVMARMGDRCPSDLAAATAHLDSAPFQP